MTTFFVIYSLFLTFALLSHDYTLGDIDRKEAAQLILFVLGFAVLMAVLLHFIPPFELTIGREL
jgi:uncharacterized membrane protein YccC